MRAMQVGKENNSKAPFKYSIEDVMRVSAQLNSIKGL